jgi:FtsH-binding integral membrane protein
MVYATSSLYKTFTGSRILFGGDKKSVSLLKLLNSKKEFLIYVFSNLIAQLGITYYVMMKYTNDVSLMTQLLLFVAQLFIIFILAFFPMPSWIKFIIFSIFSLTFGIQLSALKKKVDVSIMKTALVGTMGIFASMVIAGVALILFGINLSRNFGLALLNGLLILILTSIVFMFMGTYSLFIKIFASAGLFLFSLYIVYDTNSILQRDYYGDFITASLDYYLDIVNIFVNMINLGNN